MYITFALGCKAELLDGSGFAVFGRKGGFRMNLKRSGKPGYNR